jgi:hypothetical protein
VSPSALSNSPREVFKDKRREFCSVTGYSSGYSDLIHKCNFVYLSSFRLLT